jgi:hypothetical protein
LLLAACGGGDRGVESLLDPDIDPDNFFTFDVIVLHISGTISGDPPEIEFEPVLRQATDDHYDVETGPWTLTIETSHGSLDVPFDVTGETGGDHPPTHFTVSLQPAPAGLVHRISVSLDGDEIGSVEGTDTILTTVALRSQLKGRTIPVDEFEIEWWADHPEALAKLYLAEDDDNAWTPISDWTPDSTIRVSPDVVPIGEVEVEVVITDGLNTSGLRTGRFTLVPAAD